MCGRGFPWWSSIKLALSMQGAWVAPSMIRELDPMSMTTKSLHATTKDPFTSTQQLKISPGAANSNLQRAKKQIKKGMAF